MATFEINVCMSRARDRKFRVAPLLIITPGNRVIDYLQLLWIGLWQSEAEYQHQNKLEWRFQNFKRMVNRLMDSTGTPTHLWVLTLVYCMHVLNHSSDLTLNNRQPIFVATGKIRDIFSAMMYFQWLEPVFVKLDDSYFPSESPEILCYWVGIAEHVGHLMIFKVWNKQTNKILYRSTICTALDPKTRNLHANPLADDGLVHHDFVQWLHDKETGEQSDAAIGEHTSKDADYGEWITRRPPDADTSAAAIPRSSTTAGADVPINDTIPPGTTADVDDTVPTGTTADVSIAASTIHNREPFSTDEAYGESIIRGPPNTLIVETVNEDTATATATADNDDDDNVESSLVYVVLTGFKL